MPVVLCDAAATTVIAKVAITPGRSDIGAAGVGIHVLTDLSGVARSCALQSWK